MKIGFHFNADHESLGAWYGHPINIRIFRALLNSRNINISSKIFEGDLLFSTYSLVQIGDEKKENKEGYTTTSCTYGVDPNKYETLFYNWLYSVENNWRKFDDEKLSDAYTQNIHAVCFESIDLRTAEYLHQELVDYAPYIGAMEVDESNFVHWTLYSNSLIPYARFYDKKLNLFWSDEVDEDIAMQDEYIKLGFKEVNFENTNFKYTIFDSYHNFEHARRISEWKKGFGSFLAFIADDIVSQLSDIAPELGSKLWAALNTYESAETNEQLSQVVSTCRRIFEYVVDQIYPPIKENSDSGNSLGANKYKNRLFEYTKNTRLGDTNIDLIKASTETLFEQWSKLNNLANKGVHKEVYKNETRRCLIRTVLLLDDIVSLNNSPFEIK